MKKEKSALCLVDQKVNKLKNYKYNDKYSKKQLFFSKIMLCEINIFP